MARFRGATALMLGLALAQGASWQALANSCTEDAMIVFDASGSMAEMGFNGLDLPRIMEAREAVRTVMPLVESFRRIGLVVYGPGSRDACSNVDLRFAPIPHSAGPVTEAVETVQPDGETPLTEAVRKAAEVLGASGGNGQVVLVTDGRETCGGTPCQLAAELAADAAITVHVIGFRVRGRAFQWNSGSSDDPNMGKTAARCLADRTGGDYVNAESTGELIAAMQQALGCQIVSHLNRE